jgi:formiminotetrahydrofolate cyclodeaminase
MSDMINMSIVDFTEILSSKAAVPGGGGGSAVVGALGMALGSMVGNLTLGKKRYADVQDDIKRILDDAKALQDKLLSMVAKDAEVFEPLSKAYGLPRDTEEQKKKRDEIMEAALKDACSVPMMIMETVMETINLHEELAEKGTKIAISDVGVGVACCKAALKGASLNVFINTDFMIDKAYAEEMEKKADAMLEKGLKQADEIYNKVMGKIRK